MNLNEATRLVRQWLPASAAQMKQAREIAEKLGKLVSVTEPSSVNILAATAAKILELEHANITLKSDLDEWKSMFWRRLRDDEKTALKDQFTAIGHHSIRIVSAHSADCHELASDLFRVFESSGWQIILAPKRIEDLDSDAWDLAHTSGIRIAGKYPDPNQIGPKVMDALVPLVKGGIGFGATLADEDVADVVLVVGPKSARSQWP